jgi:hypothetical protein
MTLLLGPLRRAFLIVNSLFSPALERGLGALVSNPLTGYLLVLRTRGRRTGLMRAAPLGYVVLDGAIYCCAGFGETTAWYRNVQGSGRPGQRTRRVDPRLPCADREPGRRRSTHRRRRAQAR